MPAMSEEQDIGIRGAAMRSLERVPVRLRESGVTESAWRMIIDSDDGGGSITLLEPGGRATYRGDGVFLGWSQERLAAVYETLNVPAEEPRFELHQLG